MPGPNGDQEGDIVRTQLRKAIAVGLGVLALAFAAVSWVNRSSTVTGEIRDTAIVLSADHAGAIVNLELRNAGREPCNLIIVLTSLPVDALPMESGRVVVYDGSAVEMGPDGKGPPGVPMVGGGAGQIKGVAATLGQAIRPGDVGRFQVAFDGTPQTDDLVILCNGEGEYAAGRRAALPFER